MLQRKKQRETPIRKQKDLFIVRYLHILRIFILDNIVSETYLYPITLSNYVIQDKWCYEILYRVVAATLCR